MSPTGGERTGLVGLVVAAGGYGVRLGAQGPKQYVDMSGSPMLLRTLQALDACAVVHSVVVVVNPEDVDYCRDEVVAGRIGSVIAVVAGGSERALSVRNGLRALAEACDCVVLGTHDGARPLLQCRDLDAAADRLAADPTLDGVVLARPASDTVKLADEHGVVIETVDRRRVWLAQTPQIFRRDSLLAAYRQAEEVLVRSTDDCSLVEAAGGRVALVVGSPENLKVTTPVDLMLAEAIFRQRQER